MSAVHRVKSASSTNDLAKELAAQGALDGTVVVAESQEAGRGRRGRDWFSPPGSNVYLSYIHRSGLRPAELSALTLDAASAVASALEDMTGLCPALKWPNDLLVGGRKIAGILTEMHTEISLNGSPVIIVGVGVNVAVEAAEFPEALRGIATSVLIEAQEAPEPAALAALIGRRLKEKLSGYEASRGPDLSAYLKRFPFVGARVAHDGEREGTIEGVGADGALCVRFDGADGAESIATGEIRLLSGGAP